MSETYRNDVLLGGLSGFLRGAAEIIDGYQRVALPAHYARERTNFDLDAVIALRDGARDRGLDPDWARDRYFELTEYYADPYDAFEHVKGEITAGD